MLTGQQRQDIARELRDRIICPTSYLGMDIPTFHYVGVVVSADGFMNVRVKAAEHATLTSQLLKLVDEHFKAWPYKPLLLKGERGMYLSAEDIHLGFQLLPVETVTDTGVYRFARHDAEVKMPTESQPPSLPYMTMDAAWAMWWNQNRSGLESAPVSHEHSFKAGWMCCIQAMPHLDGKPGWVHVPLLAEQHPDIYRQLCELLAKVQGTPAQTEEVPAGEGRIPQNVTVNVPPQLAMSPLVDGLVMHKLLLPSDAAPACTCKSLLGQRDPDCPLHRGK